eukprot:356387-Chlamydomonas_euryale.AAC.1
MTGRAGERRRAKKYKVQVLVDPYRVQVLNVESVATAEEGYRKHADPQRAVVSAEDAVVVGVHLRAAE